MFDDESDKSVNLDNDPSQSKPVLISYIFNQLLQIFNPSTNFLKYLIFLTLILFMTILRRSLTNQLLFCVLFRYQPLIEIPERNVIYDHKREKNHCPFLPPPSFPITTHFHELEIEQICSPKSYGIIHNDTFPVYFRLHLLFFDFETAIESGKNSNKLKPKSFLWKLILKLLQQNSL